MNSELIVKDVEFHGDILRAAQDPDGKVWVGVRWVCQGMGFDNERMKNERKKIQRDIVLNEGVKFYPLGSGNSDTQVLCLDLDYIPLWLAKIAITPTMQRENPVLVNKLIDYQLKASYEMELDGSMNANIYGTDYDSISDSLESLLRSWKVIE